MRFKILALFAVASWLASTINAQSFNSGSTGADGALNLMNPGVVLFDPQSFTPPLNPKGDNIFHFKTITIGPGVTVRLSGRNLHNPVFWLVQGDVRIDGTIDLSGDDSKPYSSGTPRVPTSSGAGGHDGGVGALNGNIAQPGFGPGGGGLDHGGTSTANKLLVPLVGGSGGGGSATASGGGGGGALLIASSTSITINGTISADGGNQTAEQFPTTGGSGGAIRLVAPLITGSGATLTAKGGTASGGVSSGADGQLRLEAFVNDLRGFTNGTPLSIGKPFKLFLPADPGPSVRIISAGGQAVQTGASGDVDIPKAQLNISGPATLTIEAHHVEPGTVIKLHLYGDDQEDRTVLSTPLTGTFDASYSTVSAPLTSGVTHVYVEAEWTTASAKTPP